MNDTLFHESLRRNIPIYKNAQIQAVANWKKISTM